MIRHGHGTQKQAIEAGRRTVQRESTELYIHRPDGRIRDRDNYGNDPSPPRDKKHRKSTTLPNRRSVRPRRSTLSSLSATRRSDAG